MRQTKRVDRPGEQVNSAEYAALDNGPLRGDANAHSSSSQALGEKTILEGERVDVASINGRRVNP